MLLGLGDICHFMKLDSGIWRWSVWGKRELTRPQPHANPC